MVGYLQEEIEQAIYREYIQEMNDDSLERGSPRLQLAVRDSSRRATAVRHLEAEFCARERIAWELQGFENEALK